MTIPAGGRAPAITLKAAGSGRELRLDSPGTPLVLFCATQETAAPIEAIRMSIRQRYPEASGLLVGTALGGVSIPRLMRKMAETALNNRYKESASRLPPGQDPREYLLLFPDWKGEVAATFTALDPSALGLAVIGADGTLLGTAQEDDLAAAAVRLLEGAGIA